MEAIWQWGIEFIRIVQLMRGPALDSLFKAITFLGDQEFFLILMPLIFWNVKLKTGLRFGVVFLLAVYVNVLLKDLIAHPRPFALVPGINLIEAEGYGVPSGHAQLAVIVWGVLAGEIRERWAWIGAFLLMVLIGFSRIYLGIHFPTDVFAGWLVGGILLALYLWLGPAVEAWLMAQRWTVHLAFSILTPVILFLLRPIVDVVLPLATLAGLGAGAVIFYQMERRFPSRGSIWRRGARFFVGIFGMLLLYGGLKQVFPEEGESLYALMRFVRYTLIGLWVSWIAPWFFLRLRLAPEPVQA